MPYSIYVCTESVVCTREGHEKEESVAIKLGWEKRRWGKHLIFIALFVPRCTAPPFLPVFSFSTFLVIENARFNIVVLSSLNELSLSQE